MEAVFARLARGVCHVYLDDILIFERNLEDHLRLVLEQIHTASLKAETKEV